MMKAFFITGTDTDIGKTFCTAGIADAAIKANYTAAVMKPIQTGTAEYPKDLSIIKDAVSGLYPLPEELACPYSFKLPASPHLAAAVEKKNITPERIVDAYMQIRKIKEIHLLLVEGAGGVLVPITEDFLILDLIKQLNIHVIIVSSLKLGTINHTLLTVEIIKRRGIKIEGIIMNGKHSVCHGSCSSDNLSLIEKDNICIIERISCVPIIGVIPYKPNFSGVYDKILQKEFFHILQKLMK